VFHVGMVLVPAAGVLGEGCRGLAGMRRARAALGYQFPSLKAKTGPVRPACGSLDAISVAANEGAPRSFRRHAPALPEETRVPADGITLTERVR